MLQVLQKTITLDNFYGGIAENDLDIYSKEGECGYVQSSDILRSKDFLQPGLNMVSDISGLVFNNNTVRVRGYVKRSGTNLLYAIGFVQDSTDSLYKNALFKKSTLTGTWSISSAYDVTDNGSVEPAFGVWEQGGYVYFFREKSSAGVAGCWIGQAYIDGSSYSPDWDNLNVAAWGGTAITSSVGAGAVLHSDGDLYFFLNRYIGPYDGVTKPSAITPVDLPANYHIVNVISRGHYLLIAANDGNTSAITGSSRTSKLFLWDPYAALGLYTFDDVYDTYAYGIQGIANMEGGVKVLTALYDYYILNWEGENYFSKEKRLNVGSATDWRVTTADIGAPIRKTAIDVKDNVLYFGTNNNVSGFANGIYAYGRERPEDLRALQNAYVNHLNDVSSIDYRAIKWVVDSGNQVLFASWYDGTDYRLSRSGTDKDTANFNYQSIYFRPWRNRKSQCIKAVFFHAPLSSTDRFKFEMKRDQDSAFTEIDTAIGTTGASETILLNNGSGLSANFLTGWRHKARVTITGGSTFRLEAIKFKFRTVEQE